MKKLFLLTAVFASMLFVSCDKEEMAPVANETTVTYTVEIPDVQVKSADTKAIGDGFNVDELIYEVWKTENGKVTDLLNTNSVRLYQKTAPMIKQGDKQRTVISLNLVQDQEYTILFWAQNSKADAYVTDELTKVTYSENISEGKYISNREDMAAFYGVDFVSDSDPKAKTVYLKRPFAQLNLGTKNTASDYVVEMNTTEVIVENVPMGFNVATKTSSDKVGRFVFSHGAVPGATNKNGANDTDDDILKVNNQKYEWAAMNYMFATNGGQTATVKYAIATTLYAKGLDGELNGNKTEAIVTNIVENVPLKENYRTNIVGNLLSSTTDYEVIIDNRFYEPPFNIELPDVDNPVVDNCYKAYTAEDLVKWAYVANKIDNTARLEIMQDITLPAFEIVEDAANETYKFSDTPITFTNGVPSGSNWISVGGNTTGVNPYMGKANGNGYTVSGLCINDADGYAGFFGKIDGGDSQATAVNYENIHVDNIKINNATIYSNGVAVGAVAGYVRNIKGIADCHVTNSVITGTDYTAAMVGYLYTRASDNKVVMSDCSTDANTQVYGAGNVGGIAGRNYGSIIINSHNAASVTGTGSYVGGIAGYNRDYQIDRSGYIIACTNSGDIIANNSYVGGITGYNLYDYPNHKTSEACIVACKSTANSIVGKDHVGILVGRAYANTGSVINKHHYGSWGLTTSSVSTLVNNGEMTGCFAYGSVAEITQADIDAMNAAIATYNTGRASTDASYCPYTWSLSAGNAPVLVK